MDQAQGILNEQIVREELADFFGLHSLSPENQTAALDKMMEALLKSIFAETFERLGEQGMDEYERLTERAVSPDEIARFLESKIPGYTIFVREIISEFKESMEAALKEEE
jgi:hypothetical protein